MVSQVGIHPSVERLFPPAVLRDALSDVDAEVRVVDTGAALGECDGLVTFEYDAGFLSAGLDWVHSIQSGVDRFPFEELEAHGVRLTNSAGIHGDTVGETVAGYMLQFARGLHHHRTNQTEREWSYPAWDSAFTLRGQTLCVVGLGTLGRGIAMRADALGMDVVGVRRTPTPVDHVDTVYPTTELHEAIGDARFVALAVPLTDRTSGLMARSEFEALRDDAYLINVARGAVVDQSALVAALRSDALAGAALDVFETEPLPAESPLWGMENVVVTPHTAAATHEYYRRIAALVRENVRRLNDEEGLANRVV
ncbi:D-2-hydroxyacid dehydrogenase [Halococcus hamelinensis]|uniref:Phosphoglycerate dehydrogenase-like oxidoreductase n=1 Tax=Halococcus hamelinensis 100A6 TaxID=1132509 RepID=M0LYA6_9EURY|nr:D-2-hydroxyacid dehydrogenase [Halococcus hamelinensis]EMA38552.1 phosphoglycerate dehydrogenase-like oxidoreductase [Halococcus hamelinensis 100A6]